MAAEIKIPLGQLRFGKSKEQGWSLKIQRRLFKGLDNQILGEKKENTFLIKALYRFML